MRSSFARRPVFVIIGAAVLAVAAAPRTSAQVPPRSLDTIQEIAVDGSATLTVHMAFDALPWRQWKALVGDEPSRLRAMLRHQFSALAIDDFKLERDELNRTATVTMRSAAGPKLLRDGSFAVPVEKEYRLVNHTEREWFFSGNNPYAGNALVTTKVVLPAAVARADLRNPGTADQTLIYILQPAPGMASHLVWPGAVLMIAGVAVLVMGVVRKPAAASPAGASGADI